ncbi:unnamed protein product [Sphagnum jensenii]|uniref:Uncharacterized protein n=1 Tax=Sphagnum jensenii TaxID=128206 RepID=A0ABP1AWA6_9BRYO
MPDSCSIERRILVCSLGAELILTDAKEGFEYCFEVQAAIVAKTPNAHMLSQFTNPANPEAHFSYTGAELWKPQQERWTFLWLGVGQVVLSLVLVSTRRARNLASKLAQFNQLKVQSYQVGFFSLC